MDELTIVDVPIGDPIGHLRVWNLDSNGNYTTNSILPTSGSLAIESIETTFHQDLNDDGTIGVPSG